MTPTPICDPYNPKTVGLETSFELFSARKLAWCLVYTAGHHCRHSLFWFCLAPKLTTFCEDIVHPAILAYDVAWSKIVCVIPLLQNYFFREEAEVHLPTTTVSSQGFTATVVCSQGCFQDTTRLSPPPLSSKLNRTSMYFNRDIHQTHLPLSVKHCTIFLHLYVHWTQGIPWVTPEQIHLTPIHLPWVPSCCATVPHGWESAVEIRQATDLQLFNELFNILDTCMLIMYLWLKIFCHNEKKCTFFTGCWIAQPLFGHQFECSYLKVPLSTICILMQTFIIKFVSPSSEHIALC